MCATMLNRFLRDEQGQDLIEYVLLLGFVVLASVAFFMGAGISIAGVWDEGSELLVSGVRSAQ